MVREGLFSPGEKDETIEELPLNLHIIHTIFMYIVYISARISTAYRILKGRHQYTSPAEQQIILIPNMKLILLNKSVAFLKIRHSVFSEEKKKYRLLIKGLLGKTKIERRFQLLRETNLSILLVNRGG